MNFVVLKTFLSIFFGTSLSIKVRICLIIICSQIFYGSFFPIYLQNSTKYFFSYVKLKSLDLLYCFITCIIFKSFSVWPDIYFQ